MPSAVLACESLRYVYVYAVCVVGAIKTETFVWTFL